MGTHRVRKALGKSRRHGLVTAAIVGFAFSGTASAEPRTYAVGAIAYTSVVGDADVAATRDPGWSLYAGLRRRINERITLGGSGEVAFVDLNELEFFQDHEVALSDPEDHLSGGDLTLYAVTGELIWNFPVDRSTVLYAKAGAGYYSWSTEDVVLRNLDDAVEEQIPPEALAPTDDSAFGALVGGGIRFPLGENAGIWLELVVNVIAAEGGSMSMVPVRVGFSLP